MYSSTFVGLKSVKYSYALSHFATWLMLGKVALIAMTCTDFKYASLESISSIRYPRCSSPIKCNSSTAKQQILCINFYSMILFINWFAFSTVHSIRFGLSSWSVNWTRLCECSDEKRKFIAEQSFVRCFSFSAIKLTKGKTKITHLLGFYNNVRKYNMSHTIDLPAEVGAEKIKF